MFLYGFTIIGSYLVLQPGGHSSLAMFYLQAFLALGLAWSILSPHGGLNNSVPVYPAYRGKLLVPGYGQGSLNLITILLLPTFRAIMITSPVAGLLVIVMAISVVAILLTEETF